MKKALVFFLLLFLPIGLRATDITPPVLDLGTITYTSVTNNTQTVFTAATSSSAQAITVSGDGVNSPGPTYTGFNLRNMAYGSSKKVFIKVVTSPGSISTDCGTITVTDMSVQPNSVFAGPKTISKTSGGRGMSGFTNGFFPTLTATVTPGSARGTCTISGQFTGAVMFAEGSATPTSDSQYTPVDFSFSVTLVTPGASFSHNAGAYLDFGTIPAASSAWTITMSANGNPGSCTGSGCVVPAGMSADSFTFSDANNTSFTVTLPSSPITLEGGASTLTVSNFTSDCTSTCIPTGGSKVFHVGGTLNVSAHPLPGDYSKAYTVGVTY